MGISGSDDSGYLAAEIDERLTTGRWPAEEQALRKLRDRATLLGELWSEAITQVSNYEEALARKLRIPAFPGTSPAKPSVAPPRRKATARRVRRPIKKAAIR